MESAFRSSLCMLVGLLLCLSLVVGSDAQSPPGGVPAQFKHWTRNVKFLPGGNEVQIYLDRLSASGLGSKSSTYSAILEHGSSCPPITLPALLQPFICRLHNPTIASSTSNFSETKLANPSYFTPTSS